MKKVHVLLFLLACTSVFAHGQARPMASRLGDLQVGGTFTIAKADYLTNRIHGYGFYGDFDFKRHWGAEVEFHQLNDPTNDPNPTQVYERTYEFGGRYLICHCSRIVPYGKVLYGRGVYNFVDSQANLAYNMGILGGGVDVAVHRRINVRLDYEYQDWFGFQYSGLKPQLFSVGAAYHFGPGNPH